MKKKLLSLFACVMIGFSPIFAIDFFGVKIGGSLDEMTERLQKLGYDVVMFTPTKGPNAGKEIVFGNEKFRALKKYENGETTAVTIFMEGNEVNSVTLECKSAITKDRINKYFANILVDLLERYKEPSENFIKEKATQDELNFMRNESINEYIPDMITIWEVNDGNIEASLNYKEPSCKVDFRKTK